VKSPRIDSERPVDRGRRIARASRERRSCATPGAFPAQPASSRRSHPPNTSGLRHSQMAVADHLVGGNRVCLDTMFGTYLALGPARASTRPNPATGQVPALEGRRRRDYRCTGHTWPLGPSRRDLETTRSAGVRDYRCTGHTWPSGAVAPRQPGRGLVGLSITMYRTYLAARDAFSGRSTLAILETYEACVHHDRPSILGACTHDEPDILLPMYRTYLGRALTMNRTYHYR
jgi:hypothetical protein